MWTCSAMSQKHRYPPLHTNNTYAKVRDLGQFKLPKTKYNRVRKKGQIYFFYCIMIMGTHFKHEKYKKVIFIFFCIDYIRKYFLISVKSAVFGGEKKHSFVLGQKCFISTFRSANSKIKELCFFFTWHIYFFKSKVGSSYFTWHVNNIVYGVFLLWRPYSYR